MRIFYAAGDRPNSALSHSRVWYDNLYLSLVDLGHEVLPFQFDLEPFYLHADTSILAKKEFIEKNRSSLVNELLHQIQSAQRKQKIDLFFSYFYSSFVSPEVIKKIHDMGIITMNWYCNGSYQFDLIRDLAPAYDYCLVPEKFRLEDYTNAGANPIYCQEAANPKIYKPYPEDRNLDVVFVGAAYGNRPEYVQYLTDHHIDIKVYGPNWDRYFPPTSNILRAKFMLGRFVRKTLQQPYTKTVIFPRMYGGIVSDEEMIKLYSMSKISIGFSDTGNTHLSGKPIKQVRLRDFEAPMSGAFYMVEYMEELEEFYEIGKEIVCYRNKEDLYEKIKYYLKHDKQREEIRKAGHERALKDHTWQKRFQNIFNLIRLS